MNILLITTRLNLGGIGIYVTSLAKGLAQRGNKVIIASSGGELLETLKDSNVKHIQVPIDTSSEIGPHVLIAAMKLARVIRDENIDIIHAQTRVSQVIAHCLQKTTKVCFVTTCHGFFKQKFIRKILPGWGDRVIAISEAVQNHLTNDLRVPQTIIELIYNGIDVVSIEQKCKEAKTQNLKPEFGLGDSDVVGIVSRLIDSKGHSYLLAAVSKIKDIYPNIKVLIVGSGLAHYEKSLKNLCKKLSIENNVVFKPSMHNTYKALSVIDVFVLPSLQEGLGLSLIEAMAAGIPAVAFSVGGISSIIEHEHNGLLVPAKDIDALKDAIVRLLTDKVFAKNLSDNGMRTVKEKFAIEKMVEKTEHFYKNALKVRNL